MLRGRVLPAAEWDHSTVTARSWVGLNVVLACGMPGCVFPGGIRDGMERSIIDARPFSTREYWRGRTATYRTCVLFTEYTLQQARDGLTEGNGIIIFSRTVKWLVV